MDNEENPDPERELREKIIRRMRSLGQGPQQQVPGEQVQNLKAAAARLDRILRAADDRDRQELRSAAARLDQLLSKISAGSDIVHELKRRGNSRKESE
jgi:cell division protein ZapA (FtsZ GTPase activity inhibitor)